MSGTFIIGQDRFKDVTCKLGNMRKAQEFTLYPYTKGETTILIQADNRIARVDLVSGNALLSNGKGGHQGTVKLLPQLGATLVDVPADILASIKAQIGYVEPAPVPAPETPPALIEQDPYEAANRREQDSLASGG